MSAAVETKDHAQPPVLAEASVVEPTPAPAAAPVSEEKPVDAAAAAPVEEAPKAEEGEAAAAAAAPAEEKKEEKPIEPIYSGALGYKAPGLKNAFRFSKKYFWFGEEAAVPASSLSHYLRGEKAEVAHPTVAWSSVTGKGLLYFVKHADEKANPAGVLNLADATELAKDGTVAFHFKLHGGKHTFEAQTLPERNGWFVAVEKAIEEAKASKESIIANESYKEELSKLGKPAALAPTAVSTPKKSTDVTPKPAEGEAVASEETAAAPARNGSSSDSSDEEKKKKAAKSKSRSVSRGKRASIFGGILGKKDKAEEKVEEKKEEKKEKAEEKEEEKKEEPVPAEPAAESSTAAPVTAPVITSDIPPVEPKAEEAAPVEEKKPEEKKVEEKPKPAKRGSIFGNFAQKLKSPTHEKKEADLVPAVPAKEPEVAAEAPKLDEPATTETAPVIPPIDAAAPVDGTAEAPKVEEAKPAATSPHKEKQSFSFGKFLGSSKEKAKSPSTEKAPELPKTEEAPKVEETPAPVAPAAEPVTEAPKEETKEEPAAEATPAAPATKEKKRGSIFGALGSKKEGDDKARGGFGGLFRAASKAAKPKKEKEATPATKADEATETKDDKTEVAPIPEEKKEEPAAATEPAAIGDVVPEAVTVGQDSKSTPQVSATA